MRHLYTQRVTLVRNASGIGVQYSSICMSSPSRKKGDDDISGKYKIMNKGSEVGKCIPYLICGTTMC